MSELGKRKAPKKRKKHPYQEARMFFLVLSVAAELRLRLRRGYLRCLLVIAVKGSLGSLAGGLDSGILFLVMDNQFLEVA